VRDTRPRSRCVECGTRIINPIDPIDVSICDGCAFSHALVRRLTIVQRHIIKNTPDGVSLDTVPDLDRIAEVLGIELGDAPELTAEEAP
jgi:hypothetical protein